MHLFLYIGYLVVGLVQLFAIMDGLEYALGISGFLNILIAIFTTYMPLIGAGLGVYAAINVWDWSMLQAVSLFFWYIPFALIITLLDRRS